MNVKMNTNKLSRFEENQLKATFKGEQLEKAIKKRLSGYPLQYILGEWEFYGLPIKVGEGTLIPRQDTETLAEEIIEYVKDSNKKVLDICSGTGCLAIAIKKFCKNSTVFSLELSDKAISFLKENIKLNNNTITIIQ
ncbi:MAG: methyltransferase, partial [Oscillospiraceae bacterium]